MIRAGLTLGSALLVLWVAQAEPGEAERLWETTAGQARRAWLGIRSATSPGAAPATAGHSSEPSPASIAAPLAQQPEGLAEAPAASTTGGVEDLSAATSEPPAVAPRRVLDSPAPALPPQQTAVLREWVPDDLPPAERSGLTPASTEQIRYRLDRVMDLAGGTVAR